MITDIITAPPAVATAPDLLTALLGAGYEVTFEKSTYGYDAFLVKTDDTAIGSGATPAEALRHAAPEGFGDGDAEDEAYDMAEALQVLADEAEELRDEVEQLRACQTLLIRALARAIGADTGRTEADET